MIPGQRVSKGAVSGLEGGKVSITGIRGAERVVRLAATDGRGKTVLIEMTTRQAKEALRHVDDALAALGA